ETSCKSEEIKSRLIDRSVPSVGIVMNNLKVKRIDRRPSMIFRYKIKSRRIGRPSECPHPAVEHVRQILLLARLAVVQHQAEAVALVSRTLLGAVGDVLAIGRIERSRVAGRIVGGDVLCRPSADRDDPEIVVGGGGFDLVVVRGVANLLP